LLCDIQRGRHVQAGSGFAHTAFLIKYGDYRHLTLHEFMNQGNWKFRLEQREI
jgi:hypothetical protein